MIQRIKSLLLILGLIGLPLAGAVSVGQTVSAAVDPIDSIKNGYTRAGGDADNGNLSAGIKNVVNILLFVIGIIAVIVIIIGGIRYTTSGGDSGQVSGAKNTILYAIIGLIIAILAYAIVNFVIGAF